MSEANEIAYDMQYCSWKDRRRLRLQTIVEEMLSLTL